MTAPLQAKLDTEGTDRLIEVMRAARSLTMTSWSDPRADDRRRELHQAVFAFDQWEAGAMVVPSRNAAEHAAGEHADFVDMDCPTCVAEQREIGGQA